MPQSFTAVPEGMGDLPARRRVVLVTGGAGNIGSYFAEHSHDRYDLRLLEKSFDDRDRPLQRFGRLVEGDVTDLAQMKRLCDGVDTVLHLAANPDPGADWQSVRDLNITGTYNTFVAAKAAGCRRVVFASSIHAVSGYSPDVQVKTSEPVNPGDLYGVSKCFGEALARYFAEQEGLSAICLRIGGFLPHESVQTEQGLAMLDTWVSRRDLTQLIRRSIDVEDLRFAIFHGLSNNCFKRLDISDARELLGYKPVDDLTQVNPLVKDLKLAERVMSHSLADGGKSGIRNEVDT